MRLISSGDLICYQSPGTIFQLVLAMPTLQHRVFLSHQLPMNHDNKLLEKEQIKHSCRHTEKRLPEYTIS
jgi:hypothetical protein